MPSIKLQLSNKQLLFREIVFGTLVYSVVLGFFNDYTDMLSTKSYSATFLVAIVLQLLTVATLKLKQKAAAPFKQKQGKQYKALTVFVVWLILFFSKFVFLAVIDVLFGQAVEISGFVSLLVIIITMTICKQLIDYIFNKLAD